MKDLLSANDVSVEWFDRMYKLSNKLAEAIGKGKKFKCLKGRCLINLFYEPSTRTRVSFERAAKLLSADVIDVSASFSSVKKGETLIDTAKNLDMMYPDVIVLRHPCEGAPFILRNIVSSSIINAGDGCHEHPTQALIDATVLRKHLGNLKGKNIVIIGDIAHSRVARSDAILLRKLGANVSVFGPSVMMPYKLKALNISRLNSFDEVSDIADALILLRIQTERLSQREIIPSVAEYHSLFGLNSQRVAMLKKDTLILHPGPFNRGGELSNDAIMSNNFLVFRQVRTGLSVRAAVLSLMLDAEATLMEELDA